MGATSFEIGQVWQVEWTKGAEPMSTEPGSGTPISRVGMLIGVEHHRGDPVKLWFGCPMLPGRKTGEVYVSEWPDAAVLVTGL